MESFGRERAAHRESGSTRSSERKRGASRAIWVDLSSYSYVVRYDQRTSCGARSYVWIDTVITSCIGSDHSSNAIWCGTAFVR